LVSEVLDLEKQRRRLTAKKGFQGWSRRFPDAFHEETRIKDLSHATLAALIQGGMDSSMPLYEFVMGVMGMGMGPRFYYLDNPEKMAVMDIALFFLDRLRFEAMRRLGWVEEDSTFDLALIDLIQQFQDRFSAIKHQTPVLSGNHPRYREYLQTYEGDRSTFIRKLIPEALEAFRASIEAG
jgi:hypothetical protein